ncbi:MAG: PAS domain-containing protein [Candidatus Omnitrophica bacterium]|nr:PAS domain-containing protein [Candidatus Omnitrophota bacterium]
MNNKFKITRQFLILLGDLAQLKEKEQIIECFLNALDKQDIGLEFAYSSTISCVDSKCIVIKSFEHDYGCFEFKDDLENIDPEVIDLIVILTNMLGVILENLSREKLLQQKTIEAENALKTLMDNAAGMVYRCENNTNWTMLDLGGAVEAITGGYTAEQFLNNEINFGDIILPEDNKRIFHETDEAFAKREDFVVEYRIRKKNGQICWLHEQGRGVFNQAGEMVCLEGLMMDITDRKQAEEATIASEKKFRLLAETSKDIIYRMNIPSGEYSYMSPAASEIFGYSPEEFYSNPLLIKDIIHPEWKDYFQKEWDSLLKGQFQLIYEYQIIDKQGKVKWLNQRNSIIKDDQANPIAIQGIVTDITEQKAQENDLRKAKEKAERIAIELNKVQEITHVGSWYLNLATNEVVWSEELYKMYGFDCALPPPYSEHMKLFTPESWERLSVALARTVEKGTSYELELVTVRKNKSNGCMWVRGEAIFDKNNKITCVWGAAQDITGRKQIELELAESEERFRALHNASFCGIAIHDKGVILECNQGLSDMTGYSLDELIGRDGLLLIAPEYRERVMNNIRIGYEKPYEANGLRKNGEKYRIRLEARNISYKGKGVRTVEFRDITEQKKAQEQIANLAKFPEENPNPVMRIKQDGEIIYTNTASKKFLNLWNCQENKCTDKNMLEVLFRAVDLKQIQTIESKCDDKIFSLKFTPIADTDYINIYGLDITDRKKAEALLLVSNQRFQQLFDNMSSGVSIYNAMDNGADFIFKDFNESGEIIEKISKADLIGKRLTEVFPGVREFGLLDVLKRVFLTGNPERFPDKIYKDSRIEGWRRNYIYKLASGEIVAIYDDVTEQKRIELQEKEIFAAQAAAEVEKQKAVELGAAYQELKLMQSQLLQTEKMASIGQLGAGIAHELNSPLAGILSLLRSYKKEKEQNSEEYADLNEMEKACEHMAKIIKGLNSFSRQSTGEIENVDCNQTIKSILSFTAYQLEKKSIMIETDLAQDLAIIRANENQIQQIIINMITNAADACSQNGSFKICTNNVTMQGKKYVEMLFEDNGCGIKSEDVKKIFDPFFTTKRPGGGVGLGLSIVYRIVENYKGEISVDSREGQGTIFTVRFPLS